MRKLLLIICFISSLASCSSDEDNIQTLSVEGSILGEWNGITSYFDGDNSNMPPNSDIITFNSDGSVVFTYSEFGNNGEDIYDEGTWIKTDNTIQIVWNSSDEDNNVFTATIIELSDTTLQWEYTADGSIDVVEVYER